MTLFLAANSILYVYVSRGIHVLLHLHLPIPVFVCSTLTQCFSLLAEFHGLWKQLVYDVGIKQNVRKTKSYQKQLFNIDSSFLISS